MFNLTNGSGPITKIMPVPNQKMASNDLAPTIFEGVAEQFAEESLSAASQINEKQMSKANNLKTKSDYDHQSSLRVPRNETNLKSSASAMTHYSNQKNLQASIEQFVHGIGVNQIDKTDFEQLKEVEHMLKAQGDA